jgi:rod shape-determining protein MreC
VIGVRDTRRTRVVLSALLIAALALITVNYRDGSAGPLRGLRQFGGSVFGGAERGVAAVIHPVVRFFGGSSLGSASPQVAALETEVARLRAELSRAQLSRAQYGQLRRLLQVAGAGGYRIVAANVIAVSQGYSESVTLDAGSVDGVRPQETVLNGAGLVGTVTAVTAQACTVLLASDATSVVGIQLAGSGQIGWVTGTGKGQSGAGLLKLQVLDSGAVLRPGEQLVTSASVHDRPYVPGVPVGVISRVQSSAGSLTARALVRPYADFTALGVVGIVVVPPRRNPRFSVLPPKPRPTPAVTVTVTPQPTASPSATASVGAGGLRWGGWR